MRNPRICKVHDELGRYTSRENDKIGLFVSDVVLDHSRTFLSEFGFLELTQWRIKLPKPKKTRYQMNRYMWPVIIDKISSTL